MEHVSAADAQLVQVARALAFDCRVLVLDEPTTSLTDAEVDHLFRILFGAQARGRHDAVRVASAARSVPAVRSHHRAARRRVRGHVRTRDTTRRGRSCARWWAANRRHALSQRPVDASARARAVRADAVARAAVPCTCRWMCAPARSSACSAWWDRAAPSCSRRCSASRSRRTARCVVDGREVAFASARDASRAGVALVPEDRQRLGLHFNLTIRHNIALPRRARRGLGRIDSRAEVARPARSLVVEPGDSHGVARRHEPDALSGGNQQKVRRGQVARDRRPVVCCSTSRPRAWTSAPSSRFTI